MPLGGGFSRLMGMENPPSAGPSRGKSWGPAGSPTPPGMGEGDRPWYMNWDLGTLKSMLEQNPGWSQYVPEDVKAQFSKGPSKGIWGGTGNLVNDQFLTDNPNAALAYWFPRAQEQGTFGRWLRSQLDRYNTEYMRSQIDNPDQNFLKFLSTKNPEEEFGRLAPTQRGEQPSLFAPRIRWIAGR